MFAHIILASASTASSKVCIYMYTHISTFHVAEIPNKSPLAPPGGTSAWYPSKVAALLGRRQQFETHVSGAHVMPFLTSLTLVHHQNKQTKKQRNKELNKLAKKKHASTLQRKIEKKRNHDFSNQIQNLF